MSTDQEKELRPEPAPEVLPWAEAAPEVQPGAEAAPEPAPDPMEDTDRIQKAIEKVVDEETAVLPPITGFADPEKEHGDDAKDDAAFLPAEGYEDDRGFSPAKGNVESAELHTWFFTFMCMNIPIAGWIYLLYLAFSKKRTERRSFARAYLFYKLIFLMVSAIILGILIYIGLGYLDQLLAYMEML